MVSYRTLVGLCAARRSDGVATQKAHLPLRWVIVAAWHIHRGVYGCWKGRNGLWAPRPRKYGVLWLTTTGRRTGPPHGVPVGYFEGGASWFRWQ